MIKSKISFDNKIQTPIEGINEMHYKKETPKSYITINKKTQNKSEKEELEEKKNNTSLVEKIKIYHKKNAIKNKEKVAKKLYHNEINKKEKKQIKVIRNKSKQNIKLPGLKLINSNISLDNLCVTDRYDDKYIDDIHCITMATTPKKPFKSNFKDLINLNKVKKLTLERCPSSTLKNNNNKRYFHQRNINNFDLNEFCSDKFSDIFLTKQGNDQDLIGKYLCETDTLTDREIKISSFLKNNDFNKSPKRELKTHREKSFNNFLLKDIINNNDMPFQRKNTVKNKENYNKDNYLNENMANNKLCKSPSIHKINNSNYKSYRSLSKSKQNTDYLNKKSFYPKYFNNNNKNNNINKKLNYKKKLYIDTNEVNKHLGLAPIIESNIVIENENCRFLENTISCKNKIVKKRKNISDELSKDEFSNYRKNHGTTENDAKKNQKSQAKQKTDENKSKNQLTFTNALNKLYNKPIKKQEIKTKNINSNSIKLQKNNINIPKIIHHNKNKSTQQGLLSRKESIDMSISNLSAISNNTHIFNGKIEDYSITKELGKGSYAVVKLAMHKITKQKYAIKIYKKELLLDPQKRNTVKNEINILKQLDHINIMKLYEVIDTSKYLYLVLEYIKGISLLEVIKNEKNHYIEQNKAIKIFLQVVKGISYCQSKNISHRDIKLENILVLEDDTIKIIDFGFAIKSNKDSYQKFFCGTPSYMPPEIVNKEKYIPQYSDIWSLGVLLYTMLYGRFPFRAKEEDKLFQLINEGNIIFPDDIFVKENIKKLIKKIINVDPKLRPTTEEIINDINLLI